MGTARERPLVRVVGAREPAAHERAALLLDEQVALAAALPHLSDLRQLECRDLPLSTASGLYDGRWHWWRAISCGKAC